MIIFFNGRMLSTPHATEKGMRILCATMIEAIRIHNEAGRPNSGDLA